MIPAGRATDQIEGTKPVRTRISPAAGPTHQQPMPPIAPDALPNLAVLDQGRDAGSAPTNLALARWTDRTSKPSRADLVLDRLLDRDPAEKRLLTTARGPNHLPYLY